MLIHCNVAKKEKGQLVFPLPNAGCFEGDVMLKVSLALKNDCLILELPFLHRFPLKPGSSPSNQIPWRGTWSSLQTAPPKVQRLGWANFLIDTGPSLFFSVLNLLPGLFLSLNKFALLESLSVMARLEISKLTEMEVVGLRLLQRPRCSRDTLRCLKGLF